MIPSWVSLSTEILNTPKPSPSTILYSISALGPTSASAAFILATTEATGKDSGTLYWYDPVKFKNLTNSESSGTVG